MSLAREKTLPHNTFSVVSHGPTSCGWKNLKSFSIDVNDIFSLEVGKWWEGNKTCLLIVLWIKNFWINIDSFTHSEGYMQLSEQTVRTGVGMHRCAIWDSVGHTISFSCIKIHTSYGKLSFTSMELIQEGSKPNLAARMHNFQTVQLVTVTGSLPLRHHCVLKPSPAEVLI